MYVYSSSLHCDSLLFIAHIVLSSLVFVIDLHTARCMTHNLHISLCLIPRAHAISYPYEHVFKTRTSGYVMNLTDKLYGSRDILAANFMHCYIFHLLSRKSHRRNSSLNNTFNIYYNVYIKFCKFSWSWSIFQRIVKCRISFASAIIMLLLIVNLETFLDKWSFLAFLKLFLEYEFCP